MSKEKPEVGDVFENGFYRAVVLQIYYKLVHYMTKDSRCKFRQYKKRSPKDFLSIYKTYLGKSKANVEELFDVIVSDTVNDTVKE
jgi:hypothetical protein